MNNFQNYSIYLIHSMSEFNKLKIVLIAKYIYVLCIIFKTSNNLMNYTNLKRSYQKFFRNFSKFLITTARKKLVYI